MALFRDWRSPGEKWIRTDFGWRRLAEIRNSLNHQLRRQFSVCSSSSSSKASSAGSSKKVSRATSPLDVCEPPKSSTVNGSCAQCKETEEIDTQVRCLNKLLDQRCVSARSGSRESSHYSTVADAFTKLNFEQALNNDSCFPFVCQVIALVFEGGRGKLSGSMQNTLLRLTDRAKDICIATKKHSGLVLKMMTSAEPFFEKLRQEQFTSFGVRNVDMKMKSVLKMKQQLQSSLQEGQSQNSRLSLELTDLPVECLQHIAKYLTNPRDLLNFGMASTKLQYVVEENYVWRGLTVYHYGRVKSHTTDWREVFITQYRLYGGQLRYEVPAAVCLCKMCNFVFWKGYGHPCLTGGTGSDNNERQQLTPKQFLQLFVF